MGNNSGLCARLCVLFLLTNLFLQYNCEHVCPDGWTWLKDTQKCLKVVTNKGLSWKEARKYCQSLGGELLTIPDEKTQNTVAALGKENLYPAMWIGLKRLRYDDFAWLDERTPIVYSSWDYGEPNERAGTKACGYLRTKSGLPWAIDDCILKGNFACEHQITDYVCPKGWIWIEDTTTCLKVKTDKPKGWSLARKYCQQEGGDLLTIRDQKTQNSVSALAKRNNYPALWIGLQELRHGVFAWLDEKTPIGYSFWGFAEPSSYSGKQACGVFETDTNRHWGASDCQKVGYLACQRQAISGPGLSTAETRRTTAAKTTPATKAAIKTPTTKTTMKMPTPKTAIKTPTTKTTMKMPSPKTAIKTPTTKTTMKMPTLNTAMKMTATKTTMKMRTPNTAMKMTATKTRRTATTAGTPTTTATAFTCPCGWIKIPGKDKCFRVYEERLSWTDSRKFCQMQGGDLIAINDYHTDFFIPYYIKNDVKEDIWVGANAQAQNLGCPYIKAWQDNSACDGNPCNLHKKFACEL